ncbi:hypothetical protein CY0110_04593 [Crocosphaera chwakensis CCY0110]|uniref:Uncharacterized protein n=2 Tax=Crocosphaera TaxID=263510 RepID=A3ITH5_9CHRO|nr:hypothetical protein CY0110_04593 [Crocosphaera chwakensis CCY0110]
MTETLLLNRALNCAMAEDYIEWAVERLCEGVDTPNLRILAGLNPKLEKDEIESYFRYTCKELNIDSFPRLDEPLTMAGRIKRAYELDELSAETVVYMMDQVYTKYYEPLLFVWSLIVEELSLKGTGHEGCFYPLEEFDSLDAVVQTEFSLFMRACFLDLPKEFEQFIQCDRCGYIGQSILSKKDHVSSQKMYWHLCRQCSYHKYHSMSDPKVRDIYFKRFEAVSRSNNSM